jgi:hypothetical protein
MKHIDADFSSPLLSGEQPVLGPLVASIVRRSRELFAGRELHQALERREPRMPRDVGVNAGDFDAMVEGTFRRREPAPVATNIAT